MKKCSGCKFEKPNSDFGKDKRNKDGLKSRCKKCSYEATNTWRASNKGKLKKDKKAWYTKNKKHVLTYAKHYALKYNYGISIEDYARLLVEQDGRCKICGRPRTEKFALSVDHDHKTGKVRGLLCGNCNSALGHAKEDKTILQRMISYLEEM